MTVVASNYARKENDLYQTEPWATEALLRHFPVDGILVWEPAAGNHLMADVLREHGATVAATDIATYDRKHDGVFDFFEADSFYAPSICDFPEAIITNPPYGKGNRDAVRFAETALARCDGLVCLLLTAKFDFGKTRHHLFHDNPRFAAKINLVDRIQWFPGDSSGTEDHAWYVWTAADVHVARPIILYEGRIPHSSSGAAACATDTPATTLLPVAGDHPIESDGPKSRPGDAAASLTQQSNSPRQKRPSAQGRSSDRSGGQFGDVPKPATHSDEAAA